MSWRNPQFAYIHAAREVGVSAITPDATFTSGDEKYLIDDRPGVQFSWSNSAANHEIVVDLGADFDTDLDRLWIPNHDITSNYAVTQDDNAGFTSATSLATGSMTSGTDLDISITASSERYLKVVFTSAGAWSIGQLMFSKTVTLSAGPEPGWTDELVPNVLQMDNGDSIQIDSDRRHFELKYPYLGKVAATDLTKVEALIAAVSTYHPFLFDPPYDSESTIFAKLVRSHVLVNTIKAASESRRAEVSMELLEYLG